MFRALVCTLLGIGTCVHGQSFRTTVQPLPAEDLAQACHYELTLPTRGRTILGLWVINDRGPQITSFYSDPGVIALAKRHGLGLLLAHQCNSKNAPGGPEEMDMDPTHGIGRAITTAIDQFARQSGHAELSSSRLVLLGFSGTGALFAHFVEYAPARIIAAVLIHPAHYEPMALDHVELTEEGREVPELIVAGGIDKVATTQSPYDYFRRYRDQGAPWTFLVQNQTAHLSTSTAKPIVLAWLDDVLDLRSPDSKRPLRRIDESDSWAGYIARCSPEEHAASTWNVCNAFITKSGSDAPKNMMAAGWLPSKHIAELWLQIARSSEP
jgi:dienelactone hydrolase